MKKFIYFSGTAVLTIGLIMFLAACGEKDDTVARDQGKELKVGFIYISPIGSGGWTYAHDQGRQVLDNLPYVKLNRYVERVGENADATRVLTQLASQGFNLIFATSYGYMEQCLKVAEQFPDVIIEHCSGYKTAPNLSNYFGKMYQARYLSGIVAGKMTKTNIMGYVAAHPIPEVVRGINAFTLGVRQVNPEAVVKVVWTYTWFDPAKEKQAAASLLKVGADVITQHQDTPGPQQAAQEADAYSIGYNADMSRYAPKAHLTAPIWHWGVVYKAIAESVHNGTWTNEPIWWGLDKGLVGLAPFGPMVPEEVQKMVEKAKADIIGGKKVFQGPIKNQSGKIIIPEGESPTDQELFSMAYFVEGVEGQIPE
jgi:basic membrane protein A and related proteins